MPKKKTLPKTLKQYAYYLKEYKEYKEYKEKYLPHEFNQLELLDELLDELCNDEIDHYMSITSRGNGKSFNYYNERKKNG